MLRVGQGIHSLPPWLGRFMNRNVDEYLQEFQSGALVDTVRRMRNDPVIASTFSSHLYAMRRAKWIVEPASDKARDKEIADRVRYSMYGQGEGYRKWQPATSWNQRITEIAESISIGFAIHGIVPGYRDGYNYFHKLVYIHPETIMGFELDEDENLKLVRRLGLPDLPARRLQMYVFEMIGNNYMGRPMIRPMWKPYAMKDFTEKVESTAVQKFGSPVPVAKLRMGATEEEYQNAEKTAQMMRGQDQARAYAVSKEGTEYTFVTPQGQPMPADKIISQKNSDILLAGGRPHAVVAEGQSQAKAAAEVQALDAALIICGIAEGICDIENFGIGNLTGTIPRFVDPNYEVDEYPRLIVKQADPFETTRNIPILGDLIAKKAVLYSPEYERQFVERLNFEPRSDIDQTPGAMEMMKKMQPAGLNPHDGIPGTGRGDKPAGGGPKRAQKSPGGGRSRSDIKAEQRYYSAASTTIRKIRKIGLTNESYATLVTALETVLARIDSDKALEVAERDATYILGMLARNPNGTETHDELVGSMAIDAVNLMYED